MIFHLADAPCHPGNEGKLVTAIRQAYEGGVHIYPVAGSGLDERGEFSMRTEAEVTAGRYLFLTDDSGIGGGHELPHIPCYYVTKLSNAMVRMVSTELVGHRVDPAPSEILRTGGDPQSGACSLGNGVVLYAL
jgi:hypothetical protein